MSIIRSLPTGESGKARLVVLLEQYVYDKYRLVYPELEHVADVDRSKLRDICHLACLSYIAKQVLTYPLADYATTMYEKMLSHIKDIVAIPNQLFVDTGSDQGYLSSVSLFTRLVRVLNEQQDKESSRDLTEAYALTLLLSDNPPTSETGTYLEDKLNQLYLRNRVTHHVVDRVGYDIVMFRDIVDNLEKRLNGVSLKAWVPLMRGQCTMTGILSMLQTYEGDTHDSAPAIMHCLSSSNIWYKEFDRCI